MERSREMAPPRPCPVTALADELVDEILLRLPPDDPASLVRASLVCKLWRRLLSDPAFPRRYRAFHRAAPLLGFLHNQLRRCGGISPRFVPTTTPSPVSSASPPADALLCWALDCRHGRALIYNVQPSGLVVWDPVAGGQKHVPLPDYPWDGYAGAVLCAVDPCDHLACGGGPFRVVLKGTDGAAGVVTCWAGVYSSETGVWSAQTSIHIQPISDPYNFTQRSVIVGGALYFTHDDGHRALRYDLGRHDLSVIGLPAMYTGNMALVAGDDGSRLGIAGVDVHGYRLHLWWLWQDPDGGVAMWVIGRMVELDMMLSLAIGDPSTSLYVVGFAESAGTIFVGSNAGIFSVDIKSGDIRKLCQRMDFPAYTAIFPYETFYTPGRLIMMVPD